MAGKRNPDESEAFVALLAELRKTFDGMSSRDLLRVVKAINSRARHQDRRIAYDYGVVVLGQLFSFGALGLYCLLGYYMIRTGNAGYCLLLMGVPATSMATVFALRKVPATQALAGLVQALTKGRLLPAPRGGGHDTAAPAEGEGGEEATV
ncbi:hypothetical protein [Streptomyces caatingaensis]|uniref:Uncharacterized protein n=1 Tax=Streptomyces caatingaensis TaxID=1678637 RepID=A0A0K9XE67_9ACTN|nr:hypothetical protein [Streptomyces caatingaensis]KNB51533.1 hypothetical protein AC230_14215 [Streptomyces caatingaensis]